MYITDFHAINYRNMISTSITFSPGVNLLWGDNAQGKTNLLEALYTFARGKSFRGAKDDELCRFTTHSYSLLLTCRTAARALSLAYRYSEGRRERLMNGGTVSRLSEMIGHFRAVLFYPDQLQLVKGGPSERRLFLNVAISQLDPLYLKALARYEKLLANRNALLKQAQKGDPLDRDLLYTYSEGMAREGERIYLTRAAYIKQLSEEAAVLLSSLSGEREKLTLHYDSDIPGDGGFDDHMRRLTDHVEREVAAGCTLYGIQRDEMSMQINGRDARTYASQGQARSVVLALKLGEGEVARQQSGEYPVFLFDDVLSELDEGRRAFILRGAGERQMIMTSCERRGFEGVATHEIYVKEGNYEE